MLDATLGILRLRAGCPVACNHGVKEIGALSHEKPLHLRSSPMRIADCGVLVRWTSMNLHTGYRTPRPGRVLYSDTQLYLKLFSQRRGKKFDFLRNSQKPLSL